MIIICYILLQLIALRNNILPLRQRNKPFFPYPFLSVTDPGKAPCNGCQGIQIVSLVDESKIVLLFSRLILIY